MSRIGKKPVIVPAGVQVKVDGNKISVKGPKGALERELHPAVKVVQSGAELNVSLATGNVDDSRFHGLTRTILSNMVEGVTNGYTKTLSLVGVGYRAQAVGKGISMTVGYSHPIEYQPPTGITVTVDKQTTLIISGASKELVGEVAAKLRDYKHPEPYHGKGIRYVDEVIKTKVGKAAGKK